MQELILSRELGLMERTHSGTGLSGELQPREGACAGAGRKCEEKGESEVML